MSRHVGAQERPALLNALLGTALVVAAGLDIVLLVEIGRAAWQRATLSQRWQAILPDSTQAQLLREAASATQSANDLLATLPTEEDVAVLIASLPTQAAARRVAVTQLCLQAPAVAALPERSFLLTAQGAEADLVTFLVWLADTMPRGSRLSHVSLCMANAPPTLELTLAIPARPPGH